MKRIVRTIFMTLLLMLLVLSTSIITKVKSGDTVNRFSEAGKTNVENPPETSIQPPLIEWNKRYDKSDCDSLYSLIQSVDNGYVLAGCTYNYTQHGIGLPADILVVKTNANGDEVWKKTYGGGRDEFVYCVIQTFDEGFAVAGVTNSFGSGSGDMWLLKLDKYGNEQWSKTYGGADYDIAYSVIQRKDHGYTLTGASNGQPFLVKTDENGKQLWSQVYYDINGNAMSVIETDDGGYVLAGNIFLSEDSTDFLLFKTNNAGNLQWEKNYDKHEWDKALRVVQSDNNGYIVMGYAGYSGPSGECWLVQTDDLGNIQWDKTYNPSGIKPTDAIITNDGGYAFLAPSNDMRDAVLLKIGSSGDVQWNVTCGSRDYESPRTLVQTNDGGYAIGGIWAISGGKEDFWLVKLTSAEGAGLQLKIRDGNKWHTNVNVPFDIDGATDYIDNFEKNGKPPQNFGTLPLNIEIQNVGNEAAENVTCDCVISGIAVMIHLSGESIHEDTKVLYPIDDSISKPIGRIDGGGVQSVRLEIPMKYMCIIVGPLTLDKGDEWVEPLKMDVLFTIVGLEIELEVKATNIQPVNSQTEIFAVGNPYDLTDSMVDVLKDRAENAKEEALKRLLEMHIGVLASGVRSTEYSLTVGLHRITQTLDPRTSGINIGAIIPQGLKLIGLTVIIKEIASGLTSILSIPSSAIPGFAMIVFTDAYKLLPKGLLSAEITLETQQVTTTGVALVALQNNDVTLIITEITAPDLFEVSWKGNHYSIAIASNSTISNFTFLDSPSAVIHFNITEVTNETYFYKTTIPNEIIDNGFEIWCDSNRINNFSLTQNATHSFLYFTYQNFANEIPIPEYAPLTVLLLVTVISTFIVVLRKRNRRLP